MTEVNKNSSEDVCITHRVKSDGYFFWANQHFSVGASFRMPTHLLHNKEVDLTYVPGKFNE